MTVQTQVKVWVLFAALFLLFLMVFSSILLPFIAGMALAYSLDPLADRLEKWGFARIWAAAIILISAILVFVTLFATGTIPFGILLASSILQDGHGALPLLAVSNRAFITLKLINVIVGFVVGLTAILFGF